MRWLVSVCVCVCVCACVHEIGYNQHITDRVATTLGMHASVQWCYVLLEVQVLPLSSSNGSYAPLLVLGASAAVVAGLITQLAPVLVNTGFTEFPVAVELVIFLADLIDTVGCCSFATRHDVLLSWPFTRRASRCELFIATLGFLDWAHF